MEPELLTQSERSALVVLLAFMAATDGEVRNEERVYITTLCDRLDIPGDPFDRVGELSLYELCAHFRSPSHRAIAMVQLLQAAWIDGEYHSSEARGVRVIASLFELEDTYVDALEQWVVDGIDWTRRGEALLHQAETR